MKVNHHPHQECRLTYAHCRLDSSGTRCCQAYDNKREKGVVSMAHKLSLTDFSTIGWFLYSFMFWRVEGMVRSSYNKLFN